MRLHAINPPHVNPPYANLNELMNRWNVEYYLYWKELVRLILGCLGVPIQCQGTSTQLPVIQTKVERWITSQRHPRQESIGAVNRRLNLEWIDATHSSRENHKTYMTKSSFHSANRTQEAASGVGLVVNGPGWSHFLQSMFQRQ